MASTSAWTSTLSLMFIVSLAGNLLLYLRTPSATSCVCTPIQSNRDREPPMKPLGSPPPPASPSAPPPAAPSFLVIEKHTSNQTAAPVCKQTQCSCPQESTSCFYSPALLKQRSQVNEAYNTDLIVRPAIGPASEMVPVKPNLPKTFLFISIGTAPKYWYKRKEIRETWLKWIPDASVAREAGLDVIVAYRFFTEAQMGESNGARYDTEQEQRKYQDMVLQELPGGYLNFGWRGLTQINWALKHYDFKYYMRLDDDSFPCLDQFLFELRYRPRQRFFWGKYHRDDRTRADENFMLFSRDIVDWMDWSFNRGLFAVELQRTLALNFGAYSTFMNLTIFDDQERFDSFGYHTKYMHRIPVPSERDQWGTFCKKYIYSHHVHEGMMYAVFNNTVLPADRKYPFYPLKKPPPDERTQFHFPTLNCQCHSITTWYPPKQPDVNAVSVRTFGD